MQSCVKCTFNTVADAGGRTACSAGDVDTPEGNDVIGSRGRYGYLPFIGAACTVVLVFLLPRPSTAQQFWGGPFITLAWDPSPDPQVAGYVVYVGTEPKGYVQSYDVGNRTSFVYPYAKFSTRYYFAVASYDAGRQTGVPSGEVSGSGRLLPPTEYLPSLVNTGVSSERSDGRLLSTQTLGCRAITGCHRTAGVITRAGEINAVASTPNGAVWFIEDSRHVYTTNGNALDLGPSLAAERPAVQLAGISIGSNFQQTRWVFLEEIETLPDGRRELTIARYRELANTLAERAAIVTGIRLPARGNAPFTVDTEGRIYIAVPAQDEGNEPYGGAVLAFEADGTTLTGSRLGSPILSHGFSNPTGLLWDSLTGYLWLSGTSQGTGSMVARTPARSLDSREWPAVPAHLTIVPASGAVARRAGDTGATNAQVLGLTAGAGRFLRLDRDPAQAVEMMLDTSETVSAVTSGPGGVLYGVARSAGSSASRIITIFPEPPDGVR